MFTFFYVLTFVEQIDCPAAAYQLQVNSRLLREKNSINIRIVQLVFLSFTAHSIRCYSWFVIQSCHYFHYLDLTKSGFLPTSHKRFCNLFVT